MYQRNAWYVAALPRDIERSLKSRVILEEPVLLYRTENGEVVAIQDRCPHRFAPLSLGTLFGDVVQCKYHGLRFDRSGHCALNPHGEIIAPNLNVRSYPVEERHGLIWIWMGDPAIAQREEIPDLSYMEAPNLRTVHNYMNGNFPYHILVDNLLDVSHLDYLHAGSFSGGTCERSKTTVRENGNEVVVLFNQWAASAPPGFEHIGEKIDQLFQIQWSPGQVLSFEWSIVPVGGDLASVPKIKFTHIATPETERTTHYFMSLTRGYAIDDPKIDAEISARQLGVIQREDSPMLEAINIRMDGKDLLEMHPVILPTDVGALRVRRVMKRLINEEAANSNMLEATP